MISDYPILRLMDNLSVPAAIVDADNRFIQSNRCFGCFLQKLNSVSITSLPQLLTCLPEGDIKILRKGADWFRIIETETGQRMVLQYFAKAKSFFGQTLRLLTVVEFDSHPVPKRSTLRRLFSLSVAEANICNLISKGHSVSTIALETHTTEHTVRAHLKHIFQKTGTSTQGALAHLVRRCALLPCLGDAIDETAALPISFSQRARESSKL